LKNSFDDSKDIIDRSFERKGSMNNSGEKRPGSFYKPDSDPSSPTPTQIQQQQVEEQKNSESNKTMINTQT